MDRLISDEWLSLNAQLHRECSGFGSKLVPSRIESMKTVARDVGARTVLDYGCGKGTLLKHGGFRLSVAGYDPAVPEFSGEPKRADLVTCWDVLEHIEPDCLDNVLDHIHSLARKAVHFIVGTRPDRTKRMPDGRNPHLIIEPAEWWLPHIRRRWPRLRGRFRNGEIEVIGRPR